MILNCCAPFPAVTGSAICAISTALTPCQMLKTSRRTIKIHQKNDVLRFFIFFWQKFEQSLWHWMILNCKALCPISSSNWKHHLCHLQDLHHGRCWKLFGEQLKSTSKIMLCPFFIFFWQKVVPSSPLATWQMLKTSQSTIKVQTNLVFSSCPGFCCCRCCFGFTPVVVLVLLLLLFWFLFLFVPVPAPPCSYTYHKVSYRCSMPTPSQKRS